MSNNLIRDLAFISSFTVDAKLESARENAYFHSSLRQVHL